MNRLLLLFLVCSLLASRGAEVPLTVEDIAAWERVVGLEFNDEERALMRNRVAGQRKALAAAREVPLSNSVAPALIFSPLPAGFAIPTGLSEFHWSAPENVRKPAKREDLAFYSVAQLGALIRSRLLTSVELTRFCLELLQRLGPTLECVVTLTEELALAQAEQADAELAAGKYRGPLHGIPYGAKDLLATKGIKTTWGSAIFKEQVIDEDAVVITRLREAGAVLCAKLTLGELAYGDVWFGGMTRNPWNLKEGSSGSSAGSAAATSAGLLPFAIGSETWGSIISPARQCGVTGLRPTFGRVSRSGAMALSWSMDKLGPMARSVEDCALVFNAIVGPDGRDPSVIPAPFRFAPLTNLTGLKIGHLMSVEKTAGGAEMLAKLRELGAELRPIELPRYPMNALMLILTVEAAAAFEEITRDGRDDQMVRQAENAWPNQFRAARAIPAVEYVLANRIRALLIQDMARLMESIDLYVAPIEDGYNSLANNLTGHPCVVLPNGFKEDGSPTSITLIGRLFEEGTLLAAADLFQRQTAFHRKHPKM